MPTCNKHQQQYDMDEYCIYCGPPQTVTMSATDTIVFEKKCFYCGELHPIGVACPQMSISGHLKR